MELKFVKHITKFVKKSKKTIVKHAPQIMAAAGVGCFVAATYCAIKETPSAMEKLKEKEELDPDMTLLQKAAVVGPEYKKTLACTAGGIGLTVGAWKVEASRMAELAGVAATALANNRKFQEAAEKVVGEEKAKEITEKVVKDECPFEEDEDPSICLPDEYRKVPCLFKTTGQTFIQSRKGLEEGMEQSVNDLHDNGYVMLGEVGSNIGALTSVDIESMWAVSKSDGFGYSMDECREELAYIISPWEAPGHRLGWEISMYRCPHDIC